MKLNNILLCALSSGLFPEGGAAYAAAGVKIGEVVQGTSLPEQANAAADLMVKNGSGGFSVGIGRGDHITSLVNFGGMQPDTPYPIASASKFLAAATVMSVVDEGKLSLDQPVSKWLVNLPNAAGRLTLRQLLAQTSGLAGTNGEFYDLAQDHRISLAQSAQDVASRPLISEPGKVFAYGGPGFQIAGAAVEAVTGQKWAEVFTQRIATPLGMTHTWWMHIRLTSSEELPVNETLNPVLQGGAVSTAEDYLRFLSMLAQGGIYREQRILSQQAIDEMLTDQTSDAYITPTGANVLVNAHYSLGNWCESWDEDGVCLRSSSIGYFGVYPWVEKKTGRFGIIFPYVRDNAFRFWPEMEKIRDAIGS